jgi:hypothetical protein
MVDAVTCTPTRWVCPGASIAPQSFPVQVTDAPATKVHVIPHE